MFHPIIYGEWILMKKEKYIYDGGYYCKKKQKCNDL
jgi:hypothetical protein